MSPLRRRKKPHYRRLGIYRVTRSQRFRRRDKGQHCDMTTPDLACQYAELVVFFEKGHFYICGGHEYRLPTLRLCPTYAVEGRALSSHRCLWIDLHRVWYASWSSQKWRIPKEPICQWRHVCRHVIQWWIYTREQRDCNEGQMYWASRALLWTYLTVSY